MPTPLNLHDAWPLQVDKCPADTDFVEWFQTWTGHGFRVFHMGPGSHHIIGRTLAQLGDNHVTAYSLSWHEVLGAMNLAVDDADLARRYTVRLADVHNLHAGALPKVDIANLFHVGEAWKTTPTPNEIEVAIHRCIQALEPSGRLLFYAGSNAWDRVEPIVNSWRGDIELAETFKSLVIYRKI